MLGFQIGQTIVHGYSSFSSNAYINDCVWRLCTSILIEFSLLYLNYVRGLWEISVSELFTAASNGGTCRVLRNTPPGPVI